MSDYSTAARPYARAAFELAQDVGDLEKWSQMLALLAVVARNADMQAVFDSPKLTHPQRAEIFLGVCGDRLNAQAQNLLKLLAENGRLRVLPAIAEQFETYRAAAENHIEATITAAQAIDDAQLRRIGAALEKRFGKKITLSAEIDPQLIGGAVIKAGDKVIDGSLKTRTHELGAALLH